MVTLTWNFAIDRGGTFTDIVATASDGRVRVEKLLSENPDQYEDAALEGIRRILNDSDGTHGNKYPLADRSRRMSLSEMDAGTL